MGNITQQHQHIGVESRAAITNLLLLTEQGKVRWSLYQEKARSYETVYNGSRVGVSRIRRRAQLWVWMKSTRQWEKIKSSRRQAKALWTAAMVQHSTASEVAQTLRSLAQ